MTGVYLTLRCTKSSQGPVGSVRFCTICKTPATQAHFLNDCPINEGPRKVLKEAIPTDMGVTLRVENRISTFYEQLRELEIQCSEAEVIEERLEPLARTVTSAAADFVRSTLLKMGREPQHL